MKINDYLKERFPTLKLVPGIYHQWDVGIHFSLGGNMYQFNESGALNLEYFQLVHHQTAALFNELFEHSMTCTLLPTYISTKFKVITREN